MFYCLGAGLTVTVNIIVLYSYSDIALYVLDLNERVFDSLTVYLSTSSATSSTEIFTGFTVHQ